MNTLDLYLALVPGPPPEDCAPGTYCLFVYKMESDKRLVYVAGSRQKTMKNEWMTPFGGPIEQDKVAFHLILPPVEDALSGAAE